MNENRDSKNRSTLPRRVLLLLTARTYRAQSFITAAERLGIEVIKAIDMDRQLADYWDFSLGLQYDDPQSCLQAILNFATDKPLGAIAAVDDSGAVIAAIASQALGLPHNSPEAAEAARDKHRMRQLLEEAGVQSPRSTLHHFIDPTDIDQFQHLADSVSYPCILKPLHLNGSRGVIRANNPYDFVTAARRLARLLWSINRSSNPKEFLVEQYLPGGEVALEGILDAGRLEILALFDKPDPLEGPFFEETIYVTPSRLPEEIQAAVFDCTKRAASAIGLREGPIHAELRINDQGPWVIEIAGRSIGGFCSKTLRFGTNVSLEELILRNALGMEVTSYEREKCASGVMMIPIPEAGLLKSISGCEEARSIPLIEGIEITARVNNLLIPLPEGDSYLGFIFAKGDTPGAVEAALRNAHRLLKFEIAPQLPLVSSIRL